jgi:hypothetical protein
VQAEEEQEMDLKTYYQKIRDTEATIPTTHAVVASLQTDDGGKTGVLVEVSKHLAAKMLVEGSAQLATASQVTAFQQEKAEALKAAEDAAAASKVEVTMVSSDDFKKLAEDMRKLKGGVKPAKE